MRILVWGLGYVGTVSAVCLAHLGHEVVGVEPHPAKVQALNSRRSPVKEPGLQDLIHDLVGSGRLRATQDGVDLVPWADVSLICVGTPSAPDGGVLLDYVRSVSRDIGQGLRQAAQYHVVVLRSTVFPGTTRRVLMPLLEKHSQRCAGVDFGVAMNPEFMREAAAVTDFYAPPYTVIGQLDSCAGQVVEQLYSQIEAPLYRVALEEAELLKLANNAFHAVKIGFANEVGRLCDRLGVSSQTVMQMVCADTKLNISPAYLRPGFAFGGSCLPKDLRSLTSTARRYGAELPILESILVSNRLHVEAARMKIHALGARRVAILGLSFKPHTDDLRESPVVSLIQDLWRDGLDLTAYDPDVSLDEMQGSNRDYLERHLPQALQILRPTVHDALRDRQAVIISQQRPEFARLAHALDGQVAILDLMRLYENQTLPGAKEVS